MYATTIAILVSSALIGVNGDVAAADSELGAPTRASVPNALVAHNVSPTPGRQGSSRKPLPTVVFDTTDMTSAIGNGPIVITVNNFGMPVGDDLLKALAREVHLYTADLSQEVDCRATVRDVAPFMPTKAPIASTVKSSTGPDTNPMRVPDAKPPTPPTVFRSPRATIEIQPLTDLPDGWYVLRVVSIPNGLALPRFGERQTLPDGTVGVRISPGSHPRPAAFKVCPKDAGMTVVSIEWSEAVARASYPQTTTSIRELSKSSIGGECVADPAQSAASPRSTRFLCQNVPGLGARFLIGLDKSIKGAGGGSLDMPIDAVSGKAEIEVAVDSMQAGGEGCKLYKRW